MMQRCSARPRRRSAGKSAHDQRTCTVRKRLFPAAAFRRHANCRSATCRIRRVARSGGKRSGARGRGAMNAMTSGQFSRRAVLLTAGAPVLAGCAGAPGFAATPLSYGDAELAAWREELRCLREIGQLQHLWGHYAEAGRWRDTARLFAAAGVWTDGERAVEGGGAVAAFLRETMGAGQDGLAAERLN